jgi:biopolymer transport protein ExbB
LSAFVSAQEDAEESVQASTITELLQLVKEGKTKEQSINNQREKEFLANKNKQASILAAEKKRISKTRKDR